MPVWPKSFHTFGLSLKTAGTEWKLRHKRTGPAQQERIFKALTNRLAQTTYWRTMGIEAQMPYPQFQARIPLHTYAQLTPALNRMKHGEADVLWPGSCALFALSSGTATGEPKVLPVTEELLAHFRHAGRDALLYYTVRAKNAGVFRGRHLLHGNSVALTPLPDTAHHESLAADLSGILALVLPSWAEKHLFEPGMTVARMADWDQRSDAIIERTSRRDISLLAGLPTWLLEFAGRMRKQSAESGRSVIHLQEQWPNLECILHTGVAAAPVAAELRTAFGPAATLHEVYAAAEGVIATQDTPGPGTGLRLMADLGLFFEFLPTADFDPARLESLGPKALPLSAVRPDVDYALVLTTPGGLARYVLGDVVRFVSTEPPRLLVVGHTELQLNAFGEHMMEKEMTDALVAVCSRHQWSIANFHIAPLFTATAGLTGHIRGSHEWWLELIPGTVATPTGPQIAAALETELFRTNPDYAARRKSQQIEAPTVRLVMPGVFEHWLRFRRRWGGQHKLPRCRSDRIIADELAQITHFARD